MSGSLRRLPGFRWLWLGQTLLFAGVQFWFVAVTWLMLLGGVLSDRHPPRTMAVRAGWILALATGVLTLLAGHDALALGPVLVRAAVFGAAEACVYPAALALLPRLLEARHLGLAHGWLQGSEQISNVAGPALAGLSLGVAGATAALALDTALLLLAVGCFVQVRLRLAAAAPAPSGGLAQGLREGIAFAWGHGAISTRPVRIAMINLVVLGRLSAGLGAGLLGLAVAPPPSAGTRSPTAWATWWGSGGPAGSALSPIRGARWAGCRPGLGRACWDWRWPASGGRRPPCWRRWGSAAAWWGCWPRPGCSGRPRHRCRAG